MREMDRGNADIQSLKLHLSRAKIMNTRELIAQLQEADPTGDAPVVDSNNREIYVVEHLSAYWDGLAQLHIVNESKKPYWHIDGIRVTHKGSKVRLTAIGAEEFIENFPEGNVVLECPEWNRADWEARVEAWRQEMRDIIRSVREKHPELSAGLPETKDSCAGE